jgi:hypothetical protein
MGLLQHTLTFLNYFLVGLIIFYSITMQAIFVKHFVEPLLSIQSNIGSFWELV